MSLDHHPGFDTVLFTLGLLLSWLSIVICERFIMPLSLLFHCLQGGALWFQNLTEIPNGLYGPLFPFLIAGLHYTNTQVFTLLFLLFNHLDPSLFEIYIYIHFLADRFFSFFSSQS